MSGTNKLTIKTIVYSEKIILSLILILFTAFFSYIEWLRLVNFYTSNWDLGIIGQSLWTTTHGYLLFETTNYVHIGATSFLIIHSTFIAVPLSYLYILYPGPVFLLILQALIVTLSSIPLFYISKDILKTRTLSFVIVIVFLLSVGIISSILYDFHWESFIPLEFFSFYYFYYKKRYLAATIVFILGCGTLEVFPFLAAGLILFILSNNLESYKIKWSEKTTRIAIIFLFVTAFSFIMVRFLQKFAIPYLVGFPPSLNSVSNSTLSIFHFSFSVTSLISSLSYWGILYFSLLFIPLLYPKHFFSVLPWIISSVFITPTYSISLGNQYAFIAIPGIMLGFVYGINELRTRWKNLYSLTLGLITSSMLFLIVIPNGFAKLLNWQLDPNLTIFMWSFWFSILILHIILQKVNFKKTKFATHIVGSTSKKYFVIVLILLLVATNLFLSPLNSGNFKATNMPGYQFKYSYTNEISLVGNITRTIPQNSTILASDNLFPFVMNHDNSYSLRWTSFNYSSIPYFPFNSANLPTYLLLSSSQLHLIPTFISEAIAKTHRYGLLSYIYEEKTYPGSIYLLETGYKGNTTILNSQSAQSTIILTYQNLSIGPNSVIGTKSDAQYAKVITGPVNGFNVKSPVIWYGPYFNLLPGYYKVSINLSGSPMNNAENYSGPVLYMNANTFVGPYYYSTYIFNDQLVPGKWTTFTYYINITNPYPTEFRGYYYFTPDGVPAWTISLNYIQIQKL